MEIQGYCAGARSVKKLGNRACGKPVDDRCISCGASRAADFFSGRVRRKKNRSEEHTSELQSRGHLVCRLLLEKKKQSLRTARISSTTYAAPFMSNTP